MKAIYFLTSSLSILVTTAAFAAPTTLTGLLSTRDHTTSARIDDKVVKMAADIDGTTINCKPKSTAENQQYLNFSFKLEKQSRNEVKVTVTTDDGDNSIGVGGDGIIELTTGLEFSQLMIGDDGRRVITFATPGKNFASWGQGTNGTCDDVSVAAYFDGFNPADVAECCADIQN